jgi:hypothetical protein
MVAFSSDIRVLFSDGQIHCMKNQGVALDDFAYMSDATGDGSFPDHANARHVLARLRGDPPGRRMPPNGPYWTQEMLDKYQLWMDGGYLP